MGTFGMYANFCIWAIVQLLSKCCANANIWSGDVDCIEIYSIKRYMYSYCMILIVWGRWKCLDVALQAGGNFRIWNGCWSSDEFVTLSGQIIVMADSCVAGVKRKIQRFDVIIMGGNAGGLWKRDREHCAPISWSFLAYKAAMHDCGFVRAWNGASIFVELCHLMIWVGALLKVVEMWCTWAYF